VRIGEEGGVEPHNPSGCGTGGREATSSSRAWSSSSRSSRGCMTSDPPSPMSRWTSSLPPSCRDSDGSGPRRRRGNPSSRRRQLLLLLRHRRRKSRLFSSMWWCRWSVSPLPDVPVVVAPSLPMHLPPSKTIE
jgi:hypothetical protein